MIIDSHAHLCVDKYGAITPLIDNFVREGGVALIDVGCSKESIITAKENAEKYRLVYFSVGYHPEYASDEFDFDLSFASHPKCVAIGEVGLDYHYEGYDKAKQAELFERQILFAKESGLPLIIHSRDASADMLSILKANKNHLTHGFLMHCYSESLEQAKNYLDLGGYFGFGGAITFKNSKRADLIKSLPIDRLLAETDSPYMAPTPYRGSLNEPAFVSLVYDKMAETLSVSRAVLEEQLKDNFTTFFKKVRL